MLLRFAHRLNGFTDLFLTKLDVLSKFDKIKVCVAYDIGGETVTEFPYHQSDFHHAKPIYEELDGWGADITGGAELRRTPRSRRDYIRFIEEAAGVPVSVVSVGPAESQTIGAGR